MFLCEEGVFQIGHVSFFFFSTIVQKINELEAALQKKDEDMKAMEERYKMYLEKARNVSGLSSSMLVFVN